MRAGASTAQDALNSLWLKRLDTMLRSGGLAAAAQVAEEAFAAGADDPAVLNLAAQGRYGAGRVEEAVALLEHARATAPANPDILNSLGICRQAQGDAASALEAFDAAVAADPGIAAIHGNRAGLLKEMGDIQGARAAYANALDINRQDVDALAGLAWLEAEAGDAAIALPLVRHALNLAPSHELARLAAAAAAIQMSDTVTAETFLTELVQDQSLSPINRSIALGLAGDLLDKQGRPREAFAAYQAGNTTLRAAVAHRFSGGESATGRARRLSEWFQGVDLTSWRHPPAASGFAECKTHVFLVGFPRSGTTLLENVLAAHPEVISLEEKDCLEKVAEPFLATAEGCERLLALDEDEADRACAAYWTGVRRYGVEPAGRTFIDKFPLSSISLPVIARLFPEAKILFAVRDPRDVVLSCFRRRFSMNPAMFELLSLEGAAAFYDAVMHLSEEYREALRLARQTVRHESLVDAFEPTARDVCAFLGLDWSTEMHDFAAKARERGIATPSAAQVARGLNRDGRDVWRRYAELMAPALPVLEPWVRRLDYGSE